MKKILISSAVFLSFCTAAHAFEVVQDVDPAVSSINHPFKILDVAPGMPFEDIKEAARNHEIGLSLEAGTYGIRGGTKSVSYDTEISFKTPLFESPAMYRNLPEYDWMKGRMSSPASGSVATYIERGFRIPMDAAPSWDSLIAQLVQSYGEPSFEKPHGNGTYWILDADGTRVDGDPSMSEGGCQIPPHAFSYQPADYFNQNFCSIVYMVSGTYNHMGLTARFYIQDVALQMADMKAMSAQMDAEMNLDSKPSDLDL